MRDGSKGNAAASVNYFPRWILRSVREALAGERGAVQGLAGSKGNQAALCLLQGGKRQILKLRAIYRTGCETLCEMMSGE